jgi:hypothetical protein
VDPLTSSYPWYTPYQFAGNKPIAFIDLDGLEEYKPYGPGSNSDFAKEAINMNVKTKKFVERLTKVPEGHETPAELANIEKDRNQAKLELKNAKTVVTIYCVGAATVPVVYFGAAAGMAITAESLIATTFIDFAASRSGKFVIGTTQDISEQMAVRLYEGQSFSAAFNDVDYANAVIKGTFSALGIKNKWLEEGAKTIFTMQGDGELQVNKDLYDILTQYGLRMSVGSFKKNGGVGFDIMFNIGNKGLRGKLTPGVKAKMEQIHYEMMMSKPSGTIDDFNVRVDHTAVDLPKNDFIETE